ncbi:Hsp20/alpha crystallin family protein [Halorubellus sp. JP-L1]|nr:Hsp20/alpha crystallin family protein [Halorubellus sp. JP-L1]
MSQMFEQMDRMFENMWTDGPFGDRDATQMLEGRTTDGTDGMARRDSMDRMGSATNLYEDEDSFVFVMDLPGFETDEIDLVFHDGHLEIAAATEVSEESETSFVRHSRRTNETVAIPGAVDVEAIEASYQNGVLEVTIPILEDEIERGHEIDVR